MKIYPSKTSPILTIVACVHGDETFGLTVIDHFKNHLDQFPGLQLVIANEEAVAQKKRFIDTDLNRSFAVEFPITHEERLAVELLDAVRSSEFVLDIHNTTSDIFITPIVTVMNDITKRVINLCPSREVAFIQKPLSDRSFIGQLDGGVSLEFGFDYAKTDQAIIDVEQIVTGLLSGRSIEPMMRELYCIDGSIPKSIPLPDEVKNFQFMETLGVYPFLFGERAYPTIYALSATEKYTEVI